MGKRARSAAKDRRLKAKRAKKSAMRALWESYRDQGVVKGSKRQKRAAGRQTVRVKRHALGQCGNVGCMRCSAVAREALQRLRAGRRGRHAGDLSATLDSIT